MPIMDDIGRWVSDSVGQYNKGYFSGGVIPGQPNPVVGDDVQIKAKKGEYVIPMDVVQALGSEFFDNIVNRFHEPSDMQGQQNGMENVAIGRGQSAIPQNPEMQPNVRGYAEGRKVYGEGDTEAPFTSQNYPVGADIGTAYSNWKEGVSQLGQNVGQLGQAMGGNITPQQPTAPMQVTTATPPANVAPSMQAIPTFTDANLPAYTGFSGGQTAGQGFRDLSNTQNVVPSMPKPDYTLAGTDIRGYRQPDGNMLYTNRSDLPTTSKGGINWNEYGKDQVLPGGQQIPPTNNQAMDWSKTPMSTLGYVTTPEADLRKLIAEQKYAAEVRDAKDMAASQTSSAVPRQDNAMLQQLYNQYQSAMIPGGKANRAKIAADMLERAMGQSAAMYGHDVTARGQDLSQQYNMGELARQQALLPSEIGSRQAQSEYYKKHGESLLPAATKEELAQEKLATLRERIASAGQTKLHDLTVAATSTDDMGNKHIDKEWLRNAAKLQGIELPPNEDGETKTVLIKNVPTKVIFKGGQWQKATQ